MAASDKLNQGVWFGCQRGLVLVNGLVCLLYMSKDQMITLCAIVDPVVNGVL